VPVASPEASTKVREVNGLRLFERRIGTGPEVVVLHGGPGAHHDYLLPGFDRLARRRCLIYYDQRGGGRSAVPREVPVGWREQVADLEALRQHWSLARLTIVGYSWGGLLALLYAIEHPDRIERLALVSPAPVWRAARAEFERRFAERSASPVITTMRDELRASGLATRDPEAYRRRAFELSVAGYFHDPARTRDLTPFRITGRTQQAVWESLGEYDLRPSLASLGFPALVVHGIEDPIPLESVRELADLLGAAFIPIPDCGHVPYVESPEAFFAALDPFLPATDQ
jgi:proline iminopeptidase